MNKLLMNMRRLTSSTSVFTPILDASSLSRDDEWMGRKTTISESCATMFQGSDEESVTMKTTDRDKVDGVVSHGASITEDLDELNLINRYDEDKQFLPNSKQCALLRKHCSLHT